jgi:hypothetical protein
MCAPSRVITYMNEIQPRQDTPVESLTPNGRRRLVLGIRSPTCGPIGAAWCECSNVSSGGIEALGGLRAFSSSGESLAGTKVAQLNPHAVHFLQFSINFSASSLMYSSMAV